MYLSLISVDPGLIFWTTIIFVGLYFFLGKAAWKPMQTALKERENSIHDALQQAEKARHEMAALNEKNEELLAKTREERSKILAEAKSMSDGIVNEAKNKAKAEAEKIIANSRQEIVNEKQKALAEVKNTAGKIALEVAEKVIRKQLASDAAQVAFANKLVEEIELN